MATGSNSKIVTRHKETTHGNISKKIVEVSLVGYDDSYHVFFGVQGAANDSGTTKETYAYLYNVYLDP